MISPASEMSKVFIEAFAAGIVSQSGVRFENIPCRGRDGKTTVRISHDGVRLRITQDAILGPLPAGSNAHSLRRASRRSSIVHFQRELDFTLVILTVAYRSDFSEVTRVEEIE